MFITQAKCSCLMLQLQSAEVSRNISEC